MNAIERIELNTAEEMMDAISPRAQYWRFPDVNGDDPSVWVFRGHGNVDWKLVPSAWRPDLRSWSIFPKEFQPPPGSANEALQEYESRILKTFFLTADAHSLPLPEDSQMMREFVFDSYYHKDSRWPIREILSLLAVAQHYGIPTRLLDWSRDAKIATYFAAKDALKLKVGQKLAVWGLHKVVFKGGYERERPIECVTAPQSAIPNLHAQGGLFSLIRFDSRIPGRDVILRSKFSFSDSLDDIVRFMHGAEQMRIMICLTLPVAEASKLLRLLKEERVCAASLFPGYKGITENIKELSLLDRRSGRDCNPDIEL